MNVSKAHDLELSLSRYGLAFFAYAVVAALVTIGAGWPAQFGGAGDPANVAREFISRGTAAAPPLLPMLLLGAGSIAVRRGGAWGIAASVLLFALGILFVIAGFGEILSPDPVTTPRAVLIAAGAIAIVGGLSLAGMSARLITSLRRTDI